jgi:hypothetical protein
MPVGKEGSVKPCLGAFTAWNENEATKGLCLYRLTGLRCGLGDR